MDSIQNDQASSKPRAIAEIAQWLRLIVGDDPSTVFEIRALECTLPGLRSTRTMGGYFQSSHIDSAAAAVKLLTIDRQAHGVYLTLNPVNHALLSRRANRVDVCSSRESTTSDHDISCRRWLLVDCDPVRPSGISSSESEKQSALSVATVIRDQLSLAGWPSPIVADSGNGWHLLYRVSLPTDDNGIIQRCLHALSDRFKSETVDIDTSVFNPSRICKLYGSISRKGDNTTDRPHRRSRIAEFPPAGVIPVDTDLLKILASEAPAIAHKKPQRKSSQPTIGDRVRQWLGKRDPSISGSKGHNEAWFTACTLVRGYSLTVDDALPFFQEWNQSCQPPWSDRELLHKLQEAEEKADGEPGYMLTGRGMPDSHSEHLDTSGVTIMEFTGEQTINPIVPAKEISSPRNRDGPVNLRHHNGWLRRLDKSKQFLGETE